MKKLRNWLDRRRGIVARTQTGRPLRNADFYALADEAERGYDIEHLLRTKIATVYERFTDSAGTTVEYRPLSDIKPCDEIAGGWKPWSVIEQVEIVGDIARVRYEGRAVRVELKADEKLPVVVDEPA